MQTLKTYIFKLMLPIIAIAAASTVAHAQSMDLWRGGKTSRVVAKVNPTQAKVLRTHREWVEVQTPEGRGYIDRTEWDKWKNADSYRGSGDQDAMGGHINGVFCTTGQCGRSARTSPVETSFFQRIFGSMETRSNNNCTDKLLASARGVASYYDRNGMTANGQCAYAVRLSLNKSGIHRGGGLGHAKDMGPGLSALGYQNIYRPGMTAANAPVGAILVYDRAMRGARGCTGLGNRYGHVEIKDFGGRYLYDGTVGRSIEETKGRECRPLKGIYIPGPGMSC